MHQYIDHTYLKPEGTFKEIDTLMEEAIRYQFKSVCIQPCFVSYAADQLAKETVLVCTVIGFPLGVNTLSTKVYETKKALEDGADEIDMVGNLGYIKANNYQAYQAEVQAIKALCQDKILKVILETGALTDEEITKASLAALRGGADFIKTSTGFGPGQATVEAVKLMASIVQGKGVKASGGVRTFEDAQAMIEAGATRIGTSNGVAIITGHTAQETY